MSTASFTPALCRFAWKEYRTLRALWLSVAALAAVEQLISRAVSINASLLPEWLFASALFSAVLYAVGAASIVFAVEHDEETYSFLSGLPATWPPLFVGKTLVVIASSLALAAMLIISGWAIADCQWPSPAMTQRILVTCGVGIFEAIAWGTFFSILVKRPLVAAMLALVIGTFTVQWIVATVSGRPLSSGDPSAYGEAATQRFAAVLILMCFNAILARRWLYAAPAHRAPAIHMPVTDATTPSPALIRQFTAALNRIFPRVRLTADSRSRRAGLSRLIWQTWRQSWRSLIAPIVLILFLVVGASSIDTLTPIRQERGFSFVGLTAFLLPALCGALVFGNDQRRRQYRFLAEHAALPRDVWLARHVIWLGAIIAVYLVVAFVTVIGATLAFRGFAANSTHYQMVQNYNEVAAYQIRYTVSMLMQGGSLVFLGTIAAYALGQFCSMFIRSEIMAAFASLILSILLTAWAATLLAWQLDGRLFLFPIAFGAMAATWLRVSNWLAERNTWRSWLLPAAAILTPIGLAALAVPSTRLAQIPEWQATMSKPDFKLDDKLSPDQQLIADRFFNNHFDPAAFAAGDTSEARRTAEMYLHAVESYDAPKFEDPRTPWAKPDYVNDRGAIDESRIPADEIKDFQHAREKSRGLEADAKEAALAEFIAATERPTCRFHFDSSMFPRDGLYYERYMNPTNEHIDDPNFYQIARFINKMAERGGIPGASGIDRYLPLLRACAHLRSGQPTYVVYRTLSRERVVLEKINDWASDESTTADELRDALKKLGDFFASLPESTDNFFADQATIRDVVLGKDTPAIFATTPIKFDAYVAFLANRLPWERERGLRALDLITAENIRNTLRFDEYLEGRASTNDGNTYLRQWIWPFGQGSDRDNALARWMMAAPAAATSYLVRDEYLARVPLNAFYRQTCDVETCRRATLLTLALNLYRHEHDDYPATLTDLIPNYLERPMGDPDAAHSLRTITDPYSGRQFAYVPHGLDLPLDANPPNGRLPANTPLFWSVGIVNANPTRADFNYAEPDVNKPNDEPIERQMSVYRIVAPGNNWADSLVFPLRK